MQSCALPIFHAFSGCDTTSSIGGKGKKSIMRVWKSYPEVTDVFLNMQEYPFEEMSYSSPHFQKLERLTVLIYDKSSQLHSVNTARRELFSKKGRSLENIPPTQVIENFQVNSKKNSKISHINAHMFCRMRSSIMFKEYHIRLEFGQSVQNYGRTSLHQRTGDVNGRIGAGNPFG